MVHEARGESQKAADSYRKVIEFIHQHPDAHPPGLRGPLLIGSTRCRPDSDRRGTARAISGRRPPHPCYR
jgi:hypothetical protein